jgi:hypothetical protein
VNHDQYSGCSKDNENVYFGTRSNEHMCNPDSQTQCICNVDAVMPQDSNNLASYVQTNLEQNKNVSFTKVNRYEPIYCTQPPNASSDEPYPVLEECFRNNCPLLSNFSYDRALRCCIDKDIHDIRPGGNWGTAVTDVGVRINWVRQPSCDIAIQLGLCDSEVEDTDNILREYPNLANCFQENNCPADFTPSRAVRCCQLSENGSVTSVSEWSDHPNCDTITSVEGMCDKICCDCDACNNCGSINTAYSIQNFVQQYPDLHSISNSTQSSMSETSNGILFTPLQVALPYTLEPSNIVRMRASFSTQNI